MARLQATLPTVLLTHPIHQAVIDQELRPRAHVLIARDRADLLRKIPRADGLITLLTDPVNAKVLALAPRLRAVANFAAGFNNIDLDACRKQGIRVANTPDVLTRATAELTLALLLAAARRLPEGEVHCRSGRFSAPKGGWQPDLLLGLELKGRRALVVGQGRIGYETARLFRGIGLKVSFVTRLDSARSIAGKLKTAQILSLHVPLTAATHHWLDAHRLSLLPPDAIVLNTTRGPVVDERALIKALREKKIFAAGLDVFEREPEIPRSLRKLPNVVLLPHLGSATLKARENMARLAVRGLLALLNGQSPPNEVKF